MTKKTKIIAEANIYVADLDEVNLYQGIKKVTDAEFLQGGFVPVPKDCDLVIGGYFWDTVKKTFMPTEAFIKEKHEIKIARLRAQSKRGNQ
jgi:hypothetical protein